MKRCLLVGMFALAGFAVRDSNGQEKSADNVPPPGFTALFNGKDLTNWQGLIPINKRAKYSPEELAAEQKKADDRIVGHWTVKDGVINYDGKANNLQTKKDYGNFELYVDWKIGKKGDSGLYLRGNPQVQIWDNPVGSGGLYNNQKFPKNPLVVADRPVGEWNTFFVKMVGDKVTVDAKRQGGRGQHAARKLLGTRQTAARPRPHRTAASRRPALVQEHLHQGIAGLGYCRRAEPRKGPEWFLVHSGPLRGSARHFSSRSRQQRSS